MTPRDPAAMPPAPDRRRFLGSAAVAALAGTALAQPDADPEPVRVGVIGTGARGSDLLRALTTIDGADVAAVCDTYPPHLTQGVKYAPPSAKPFADHKQLLETVKPLAVVIAVPLAEHLRVAMDCLAAGCAVFLEKTLCRTLDECRRLVARVEADKRVFQIGLQRRANPLYVQAQAMVDAGMIGRVVAIKAQWHRNNSWRRPVPLPKKHPDYESLDRQLNWRLWRATSGGLMAELGSHQTDVATWFLGTNPSRVFASGGLDHWRDGRDVFDNVVATFDYRVTPPARDRGDGQPYTVRLSYSSLASNAFEGASELVMGTRGTLLLTNSKGLLYQEATAAHVLADSGADGLAAAVAAGKTLKLSNDPWAHRGQPSEIDIEAGNDTRDELMSFLDHVRRNDPATIADARVALGNATAVLLANESAETGRAVSLPADLLKG